MFTGLESNTECSKYALLHIQPKIPHLFLYGDGDVLIPPNEIELTINALRQNKFSVHSVN